MTLSVQFYRPIAKLVDTFFPRAGIERATYCWVGGAVRISASELTWLWPALIKLSVVKMSYYSKEVNRWEAKMWNKAQMCKFYTTPWRSWIIAGNIQKIVSLAIKCEHVFLSTQIHAKTNRKNVLDWELWKLIIFLSGFRVKRVWETEVKLYQKYYKSTWRPLNCLLLLEKVSRKTL